MTALKAGSPGSGYASPEDDKRGESAFADMTKKLPVLSLTIKTSGGLGRRFVLP